MQKFYIYTAESKVRDLNSVFRAMFSGLYHGRYLAYRLFIKDIKGEYSTSICGVLWDFLEPIVLAVIFIILRGAKIINEGDINIPYGVFVVYGIFIWTTFTEAIVSSLDVIKRSKTLLTQVQIPSEALILSLFYKVLFNSMFRIVVLLILSVYMGTFSFIGFFKFLVLFPSIILVGMSIGVFLAPFNTIYHDVGRIVKISLRPLFYASPVLWAIPKISFLKFLNSINPVAIVLNNLRSLATQNVFFDQTSFIVTLSILMLLLFLGWCIFHLSIPILSDKV